MEAIFSNLSSGVPVFFGGDACGLFENLGEIALIVKPTQGSHIHQIDGAVQQKHLALADAYPIDIGKKTVAGFLFKNAAEIGTAEINVAGDIVQGDLLGIIGFDVIHHLVYHIGMLDLGEVKGVVDKPVHDSRQPDAEFFQGGKLLDFMDIVGVEEKDFPDIRTRVLMTSRLKSLAQ